MEVIRRGAADIANVYVTEAGGLLKAMRIFALCEEAGMPCMIGSMPEFGIGTAAQIHLGVAMTNLGPDSDACGVLYHEEDLLTPALRIENGFSYPPEGPGLGVTIDQAVFERWQRNVPAAAND
jgi:L-alanine-DL-glutamate epimerase-like enolase superfamily enzyme